MVHGCPSIDRWHQGVPRNARWPTLIGFIVLLIWIFGFGVWALSAPLASAVVASGAFVATGQNKQVQHFEGGIIREILVKEGDVVEANQPLVRLDETAIKSKLRRLILQRYRLLATAARLKAEIGSFDQVQLPPMLTAEMNDPIVELIYQAQETEFKARRTSLLGQEEVLKKEIAGLLERHTRISSASELQSCSARVV